MTKIVSKISMAMFMALVISLTASIALAVVAKDNQKTAASKNKPRVNKAVNKVSNAVIPEPLGTVPGPVSQLRIRFPESIEKGSADKNPFEVSCSPAVTGFSSWADNNTVWTFDLKAENDWSRPQLLGGSKCEVKQTQDLKSSDGQVWKAGTIQYSVVVDGPNVKQVYLAHGFQNMLRETEPLILLIFDGPISRDSFFAESAQNAYLSYLSSNAPSEKLPLTPVPTEQLKDIFAQFKTENYLEQSLEGSDWILATVRQNLIPGASVRLTVQNTLSGANSDVRSSATPYTREFNVRSQFSAEVRCAEPTAKDANCLPRSPISIAFNGMVKWADARNTFIEYVPYKSEDGKLVKAFPELGPEQQKSFWDSVLDMLGTYFPFLARLSDTVVDSITFKLDIEPQTQAKIVLPQDLTDINGRLLSNAIREFHVRIGSMSEIIRVPETLSFFEKNIPNLFLPVSVVNQNQKLTIRKTGTDASQWTPVNDVATMIKIIRAYEARGEYRNTPEYESPLVRLGVPSTLVEQQLDGTKNRPTLLQFPFSKAQNDQNANQASGFYAIEVSSPSFEATRSRSEEGEFFNPKYVLAQVTDLAVHLKKGQTQSVAWVTSLSGGQPVANAQVEIYNCLGEKVANLASDDSGLVSFANQEWAKDCQLPENAYSSYFQPNHFYLSAHKGDDRVLTHSSWTSSNSYAPSAPGVEWFYSDIRENVPYFHAVVGVNLVKPGQKVPVQIIAKLPDSKGFADVAPALLPTTARIVNNDDSDLFYELPLSWNNGSALIEWTVPAGAAAKLGLYSLQLQGPSTNSNYVRSGDIEVAEFKVPLMSGLVSLPNEPLVQPDQIPVSSVIRYANGVGAKNVGVDLSYYFQPISFSSKQLPGFKFGTGPVNLQDNTGAEPADNGLPKHSRPATLPGLKTAKDGSLVKDLASELASDGRKIAEILKTVDRPQTLIVRVRYQDQMGEFQTLSHSKTIFNAERTVGTNIVAGKKDEARLQAAVVDVDGKPVTSAGDLDLKIVRVETNVIGEELFGGLIKNTIQRELKAVQWKPACSLGEKVLSCPIGDLKAGHYVFETTSKSLNKSAHHIFKVDEQGRIYGNDDYYSYGDAEESKQLPLALNKKEYKNGERAVVSFSSPFKSCAALVSLERSDVISSFVVSNACEKGFVEIPVEAALAPNAFVSIFAITGRASADVKIGDLDLGRPTYKLGFANMRVNQSRFKAAVEVKTDKDMYEPGETVNVQAMVRAEEGQLKATTVTFVAIEEKILDLKKNDTYQILDALMGQRGHEVETATPLERIETVTTTESKESPESSARKGGDEGGDGSSESEFKRKLFDAMVAFQSEVPVENGIAKFSFKANDSLTRFKIFAIAKDTAQKFGTGEVVYLSEKETQSYSNIPMVAHTGDNYPVRVTIQNNSAQNAKYKIKVSAEIKDAAGKTIAKRELEKEAKIYKSTSTTVDIGMFPVPEEANTIKWVIRVYNERGEVVDVMEPAEQIILQSIPLAIHDAYIVQVAPGTSTRTLNKEREAVDGKGEIRAGLFKSLVSGAQDQIVRRLDRDTFADFFIESRFYKALLKSSESNPAELKQVLETLIGQVDSKGFIKFYPQAQQGNLFLTAAMLNALQLEAWALKLVPPALLAKLHGAVSQVLTKSVDPNYVGKTPMDWARAQAVMGRAAFAFEDTNLRDSAKAISQTIAAELKRNPKALGEPVGKWSNDDLVDIWLLGAFADSAAAKKSPLLKELIGPARLVHTGNMAQLSGAPKFALFYSDETIETAKLLLGFSRLGGDKGLARNLAIGLVNASAKGWYVSSTMMAVAQGLKSFGSVYEAEQVIGEARLTVVEEDKTATVNWAQATRVDLVSSWKDTKATVQVTHNGSGQPWFAVQALTAVPLAKARGQGLSLDKSIRNVTRDSGYEPGDIIEVTLTLNANTNVRHIALQDPIPAGSNILGEAYGAHSSGEKSYTGYKLYFEFLPVGATTVKYQFQLNNPGTFKLPPSRAEGLYMPSVFAEAPNSTITVTQ